MLLASDILVVICIGGYVGGCFCGCVSGNIGGGGGGATRRLIGKQSENLAFHEPTDSEERERNRFDHENFCRKLDWQK